MAKDNFKKKADKLLSKHPGENKVIIVENGQCFFNEKAAREYSDKMKFEQEPKTFFREGVEPEDDSDLAEAYESLKEEKDLQDLLIEQIRQALDPEQTVTVDKDTPEEVSDIVQMREALQEVVEINNSLQEELTALKEAKENQEEPVKKQDNAKTKTNSKKA